MRPVAVYTFTIAAGQPYRIPASGSSFKILAASGAVEVKGDWGKIDSCSVGQGITGTDFAYLVLTNLTGGPNTIRMIVGDAGFIDNITGTVGVTSTVAPTSSNVTFTAATVTNASAQLVAANANRRGLTIQNNDASGSIRVTTTTPATLTNGLRVIAGGYWEPPTAPTQAIYAIGDIANNPNVMVVEYF